MPFFTRRIGLVRDSTNVLQTTRIAYGVRLSGKPTNALRIGLLNIHTLNEKKLGLVEQNYSVAVAQWRVLSRSFISGFFINKESIGLDRYDSTRYYHPTLLRTSMENGYQKINLNKYNRVAGVEFNLLTKGNKWSGKTYYHHSFSPFNTKQNHSLGWQADYNARNAGVRWTYQNIGEGYNAETGFVPGLLIYRGFHANSLRARASFYSAKGNLVKVEPYTESNFTHLPDKTLADQNIILGNQAFFRNQALFKIELRRWYQKLPANFNPVAPFGDSTLQQGEIFRWNEFEAQFQADPRNKFSYMLGVGGGQFYNGVRNSVFGELKYRYPPFLTLSSLFNFTHIELPEAYGKANFILISPKLDITFTPNLFFTTFLQYNTQSDNVNMNARFQWRFKPVSDFFIVYSENYLPENLSSKNRTLVVKLTYWLNL